ncbi:MAG: dihydroorotate dehydrogenase (quinone), partial [Nostocaceae cyanobacterium]|nr:dihydroorotate dehydrogenase (quinone) [Nostocaceae cyanobacterium]
MDIYKFGIRPFLFTFGTNLEWLQSSTILTLSLLQHQSDRSAGGSVKRMMQKSLCLNEERLSQTLFGLHFPNPVGLAAGFDKDGVASAIWESLGFGFAELGTVTSSAQPGNPPPRLFRLPLDNAALNRMGFNNSGAAAMA